MGKRTGGIPAYGFVAIKHFVCSMLQFCFIGISLRINMECCYRVNKKCTTILSYFIVTFYREAIIRSIKYVPSSFCYSNEEAVRKCQQGKHWHCKKTRAGILAKKLIVGYWETRYSKLFPVFLISHRQRIPFLASYILDKVIVHHLQISPFV